MERRTRTWVATSAALLCATVGLSTPVASAAPGPVKILILGDSVAQGSAGDWTWRYRLHQMLEASGADVDFVGPRTDVYDNVSMELGADDYADPGFDDREHAARWGMRLSDPDDSIASLVEDYDPDVVIETRGINDFVWNGAEPDELYQLVIDEVAEARAVDPGVEFVLAQLPQVWVDGVDDYNALLSTDAVDLSQPGSSIVVSDTGHGFEKYVDTWDPAHLAATGEVKMAAGVAEALAGLGVGSGAGAVPVARNGHWGGATLQAEAAEPKARLSWIGPVGASEEFVWSRDLTECRDWQRLPIPLTGTSWDATGLATGHRYEFRLQAAKGTAVSDGYSNVVPVVPTGLADPSPRFGCAPASVSAVPGLNQLTVTWAEVPTATSYDVTWASGVPGDSGTRNVPGGPVVLTGLEGGRVYRVSVEARNAAAGSGAAAVATGTPVTPVPEAPGRTSRVVITPGAHRLDLTWTPVAGATAYDVTWVGRRLRLRGQATVGSPAVAITNVLAGERYDVTVTARNAGGPGPIATAVGVPRGPKVPAPTRLQAQQVGAHRAMLTWRAHPDASSYSVQVRRRGRWEPVRTVVALSTVVGRLPRGVATFRVRSWHQFAPGAWSGPVRVRMR